MSSPMSQFWKLSPDQQRALAIAHGVDPTTSPYTTPFENARYMMFMARQSGTLDTMLAQAAEMAASS